MENQPFFYGRAVDSFSPGQITSLPAFRCDDLVIRNDFAIVLLDWQNRWKSPTFGNPWQKNNFML
jgi:hypothetical protein